MATEAPESPGTELISALYTSALDPQPWERLLVILNEQLPCSLANLIFRRPDMDQSDTWEVRSGSIQPSVDRYLRCFAAEDPFPYFEMQPERLYSLPELLGTRIPSEHPFFRDFLLPSGIGHLLMTCIAEPSGLKAWVTLARQPHEPAFGDSERTVLHRLLPHWSTALHMYAALLQANSARRIYEDATARLSVGTLLLDAKGRIVDLDHSVHCLLAEHPECSVKNSRLVFSRHTDRAAFAALIEQARRCRGNFSKTMRPGNSSLGLLIRALPSRVAWATEHAPVLAVHVTDPARVDTTPVSAVAELFDLSRSEAALAIELANGRTLVEAARQVGLSEQSARTYAKRIFSKTATHRQPELVRLILRCAANLAPEPQQAPT